MKRTGKAEGARIARRRGVDGVAGDRDGKAGKAWGSGRSERWVSGRGERAGGGGGSGEGGGEEEASARGGTVGGGGCGGSRGAGWQGKRAQKVLVLVFGSRVSGGTVINKSASRGNSALTS